MNLVGYEFVPKKRYQRMLMDYGSSGGWHNGELQPPPVPALPVFQDRQGDLHSAIPMAEELATVPFIQGAAGAVDSKGDVAAGFVSVADLPGAGSGGAPRELSSLMEEVGQTVPSADALQWLSKAASRSMMGAMPGSPGQQALQQLGLGRPSFSASGNPGGIGAKRGGDANVAGSYLSGLGGVSGGVTGESVANALGQAAIGRVLSATGLGPASQLAANLASGGVGNLSSLLSGAATDTNPAISELMTTGGFAGPLDLASQQLSDSMLNASDTGMQHIVEGGCVHGPGSDPNSAVQDIKGSAVNAAADALLSEWQVDDESSAAEHVAHKFVSDQQSQIKSAVSDPDGFVARLKKLFVGEAAGCGMPAVRLTDLDTEADASTMGVATIAFEGLPVSRISDLVAGPKAPPPGLPITEGAATVLSAGMPTAHVCSATAVPSQMVSGACSILVGGASAVMQAPGSANAPPTQGNGGPGGPAAPSGPNSESTSSSGGGVGSGGANQAGGSTAGQTAGTSGNSDVGAFDVDPSNEMDRNALEDLHQLSPDQHDPSQPVSDTPFRIENDPNNPNDDRFWTDHGMTSSADEYNALPDTPWLRDLMQAQDGEQGWFGNELKPGNWYMLGGLIDLGSPVSPGAGTGGMWYVPDKMFGMDMSQYYVPHDWKFDPANQDSVFRPWELFTQAEIPAFLSGLASTGGNPVHAGLQIIYSGVTSTVAVASWANALRKRLTGSAKQGTARRSKP